MTKLDFHNETAMKVIMSDGFEWLAIPEQLARAMVQADIPIEIYRVYDDEAEGLVYEYEEFDELGCRFYGIEIGYKDKLLKYVDIQMDKRYYDFDKGEYIK